MRRLYYLLLIGVVLLSACRKEKFSSESNWVAPLLQTKLDLGDLLPDSITQEDADGALTVVFEEEYGVSNLDDILQIPDRVEEIEVSLTSLVLDDRSFTDTLTLGELYPPSILLNGRETTLPAQDITTEEGTVLDVTEQFFTTATFKEGFIDISISNDLPVEAEVLEFELRNDDDKEVIISGTFYNLAPESTVEETYDLAGLTVDGVLELIVKRVKTKASDGPVLIDATKGIRTTITVRGLKPQIATAIFPAQNLVEREEETKYNFGGAELTEVRVKEGYILMKVESSIEEAIILDYEIPNSLKVNGPPGNISQTWEIPPAPKGEVVYVEERFPIDGFNISLWGETTASEPFTNHIFNKLTASIKYSGIERTLSLDDKIKIEFGLIEVKPSLVYGNPGYHEIETEDTIDIRLFDRLSGGISLDDAELKLKIINTFGIQSRLIVNNLSAINTISKRRIDLTGIEEPIFIEKVNNNANRVPIITEKVLNKSNSNLKAFLETLPNKIVPNIKLEVNPNGTYNLSDFAFEESELKANISLTLPIHFGLDSLNLLIKEKLSLDIDQLDNVKEGKLILDAKNDFPIEAGMTISFVDASGSVLFTKILNGDNKMAAAEVDATTGKTVIPAESQLVISLDRTEMGLFKIADSIEMNIFFDTKEAKRFKMFSDYTIDLKLGTNFIYENKL